MYEFVEFSALNGKVVKTITGAVPGSDAVLFLMEDGSEYQMHHSQDCCEHVRLEDVVGDPNDLVGVPLRVEESYSPENTSEMQWTFYHLTGKSSVTLRWLGESNGYYSMSVSVVRLK